MQGWRSGGRPDPAAQHRLSDGGYSASWLYRSAYLPAPRQFSSIPTEQSCCTKPNDEGELPNSALFRVKGLTVAATVQPKDMTLKVVMQDLQQVCGPLRWIADGVVCGRLRSLLEPASVGQPGDREGGKGSLRAFLDELELQHGPGKPVNDNGYWMLKVNAEYLLAHL